MRAVDVVWDMFKIIVGAVLGYLLSQRGSDRQFRRQQAQQRVGEARKVYAECRQIAVRLTAAMHLDKNQVPADKLTDEVRTEVDTLERRLLDARTALDVHGATEPAMALQQVALDAYDLLKLAKFQVSAVNQGSHTVERTWESYSAGWDGMDAHLDESQQAWVKWQTEQEAVRRRWPWSRKRRS